MMQDQYEQIEKYWNQELSDAELATFEHALQTDEALRRLVNLYETGSNALARQAATETQQATLQTTLEQLGKEYFTTAPLEKKRARLSVRARRMWQLVAAASILILAFVVGLKWYASQYYTTEILVAQNYHPIPVPATLSGNDQNLLQPGYQAYRQKNYPAALRFFTAIRSDNPQYTEAQLFAGYTYFESGQYAQAIQAFDRVLMRNDARYLENAEWHRLLAALASNDNNATPYLSTILNNPQHAYYKEAQGLQKQWKGWLHRLSK